ncbi:hypothetical protein BSBH6_02734 [Bacillus subtilis]|nr:hypothetical protein BSBH6_02734 [Bacillus subtilis]RPK23700.1 hypothetical protein BH5_02731 [Bacillus subtilis]
MAKNPSQTKDHRTKKNKDFSINGVKTILNNPLYAGFIRYNVRRDWNEKRRNNINPPPVIERGQHEAIISEEIWEKAKNIMSLGEFVEDCGLKGTLIRMRINLNNLNLVNFDEVLEDARKEAVSKGYSDSPSSASQKLKSQNIYNLI